MRCLTEQKAEARVDLNNVIQPSLDELGSLFGRLPMAYTLQENRYEQMVFDKAMYPRRIPPIRLAVAAPCFWSTSTQYALEVNN